MGNEVGRLHSVPTRSRARGEALANFLAVRKAFVTLEDYVTYLELRGVHRYRLCAYHFGVVVFELPKDRLRVLEDAAAHRVAGLLWAVKPLRWWQRWTSVKVDDLCRLVP